MCIDFGKYKTNLKFAFNYLFLISFSGIPKSNQVTPGHSLYIQLGCARMKSQSLDLDFSIAQFINTRTPPGINLVLLEKGFVLREYSLCVSTEYLRSQRSQVSCVQGKQFISLLSLLSYSKMLMVPR